MVDISKKHTESEILHFRRENDLYGDYLRAAADCPAFWEAIDNDTQGWSLASFLSRELADDVMPDTNEGRSIESYDHSLRMAWLNRFGMFPEIHKKGTWGNRGEWTPTVC